MTILTQGAKVSVACMAGINRGFDRLLKDATARKVDMIAAWSVDRLGGSLQDGLPDRVAGAAVRPLGTYCCAVAKRLLARKANFRKPVRP
jgi:hypothetical protein